MPMLSRRTPLWAGDRRWRPEATMIAADRSHALCPFRAWLPIDGTRIPELVFGGPDATPEVASPNVNHQTGTSRWGRGFENLNVNLGVGSGLDCGDETGVLPTDGNCTIIYHKRKTDATARNQSDFGPLDGGGITARCTPTIPFSDGVVYWDYGGVTGGTTRLSVGGLTVTDNVWAFTVGPRGMEIWQDGVKRASNAATPTRTDGGANFYIGRGGSPTTPLDLAVTSFAFLYRRQLSEGEIVSISLDPFQWLTSIVRAHRYRALVGSRLTVTLDSVVLQGLSATERQNFGTRFCRQHRVFYVADDRFPAPCAKWGGHEPSVPG